MHKFAFLPLALCALVFSARSETATPAPVKKTTAKPTAVKQVKSKPKPRTAPAKAVKPAAKPAPKTTVAKTSRKPAPRGAYVPRTLLQGQPSPERYKEIQQALADKGYFKGEVNGQWSADSVDALKRFQSEQNLAPDGKLGSLSLIALGLGPKRTVAQNGAPRPEPPPPAVQPGAQQ